MTEDKINYPHTTSFIEDLIDDLDFVELRKYARDNKVPIMREETKSFLVSLLSIIRPKKILEIGTAIGYSSLVFEKYTGADITTIELDKNMADLARSNFEKYNKKVTLINDDAERALSKLDQGFDFVFIDANKASYKKYFDEAHKLLNNKGVIVCDNILFRGEVCNDDLIERRKITIVKRLRKFLAYITAREDYYTSILPLGDGISLSVRREND